MVARQPRSAGRGPDARWFGNKSKSGSGRSNYRSGSSGSRVPLTEEQKAERARAKEQAKREREEERAERLLAEKAAKLEKKPHEAWRLRFDKPMVPIRQVVSEAMRRADVQNDLNFVRRVEDVCEASVRWTDVRRCAVMTLPEDMHAGMGDMLHRVCELVVVLHTKRSMREMKAAVSTPAFGSSKKLEWVPAKRAEWEQLSLADYRVLRDEAPPSAKDAKLLMAAMGADAPPAPAIKKKRPSGKRPPGSTAKRYKPFGARAPPRPKAVAAQPEVGGSAAAGAAGAANRAGEAELPGASDDAHPLACDEVLPSGAFSGGFL